jgi:hypothetical protein
MGNRAAPLANEAETLSRISHVSRDSSISKPSSSDDDSGLSDSDPGIDQLWAGVLRASTSSNPTTPTSDARSTPRDSSENRKPRTAGREDIDLGRKAREYHREYYGSSDTPHK